MATDSDRSQAPPWVQVCFHAIPAGAAPWVVLGIASRSSFGLNIFVASALTLYSLVKAWVYLWSPSAQREPGLVAAQVLSSVVTVEGCFALGYYLFSAHDPGAFVPRLSRIDAAYFAVSTATTTGMGDIHPASQVARLVVTCQMAGSLFLIVFALGTAMTRLFVRKEV